MPSPGSRWAQPDAAYGTGGPREGHVTDAQARTRVWTRCLAALVLAALTGPLVVVHTHLAHASAPTLTVLAAVLAVALVGAYVALAALLTVAVLRVVRPRSPDQR